MKKYLLRLGYLLLLAYVPSGVLAAIFYYHSSDFWEVVQFWFTPQEVLGRWASFIWWNLTSEVLIIVWPLVWLLYSWLKKPGLIKAGLLLFCAIFLAPYFAPEQRFLLWEDGYEPMIQAWELPARY